jgi:hypothetical protein
MTRLHPAHADYHRTLHNTVFHAPAIPLIAAAAGAATTAAVGSSLTVFAFGSFTFGSGAAFSAIAGGLSGFIVSTAVNQLGSRALSKKPRTPQFTGEASGRTVMVRSSVESHKIIYGQTRVSGPLVYVTSKDSGVDQVGDTQTGKNKFLHMVVPLAGHEVEEIGDIYFNDSLVPLDGNGWATAAPYVRSVERETSTVTQVSTAVSVEAYQQGGQRYSTLTIDTATAHGLSAGQSFTLAGTTDSRLDGTFTVSSVTSPTQIVMTNVGIPSISATGGSITRKGLTTSTVAFVRVKKHLGTTDQAADPDLIAECGLTADFRLRGIAYIYVRLEYSPDAFPLGIPNVSAVVKGKKVYDPRTATTAWSANAALCARDYLASSYGFGCQSDEINDTYFIAAANACDEDVTLKAGGTQDRYTCNGVIDTASAPLDNLTALLTACAGTVTYVQGKFRLHAGVYDTPSGTIDTSILASSVKLRARTPRKELFNAVKGTYLDPNKNWQPTDFPFVVNSVYEAQDGGERIYKDIELPFTQNPEAAQRIAKIILEKARQGLIVEISVFHDALKYSVFDVVTLTNPQFGWNAKPFRILKWSMGAGGDRFSPISLVLQEESSASYDWNNGEATTVDPAPDTNLPSPFVVQPPGALTVTEGTYITRSGDGVKALATMRWVPSQDALLSEYQPEYKPRSEEVWTKLPTTKALETVIEDITPDLYDFRVKAFNTLRVSSEYSTTSRQISGLLAPPQEPQNLTISTIGGLAVLRWDLSVDLDVRIGGRIVFRHSPNEADGWTQSTSIGEAISGALTVAVLPLKPGVYLAKCVDSSGIESTVAASVVTTQATAIAFAPVTSLTEHPAFSGTKMDCYVDDLSRLRLAGMGLFSDITLLSGVASVAGYGGLSPTGTYVPSGGIDLGSVKRVRLTANVRAAVINQLDKISNRTGNVSSWTSFSGTEAADADAICFVRTTNDNPSGSPTWGAWQRLDQSEFQARGFQFELRLSSQDTAYTIAVSEFSINVDEVA